MSEVIDSVTIETLHATDLSVKGNFVLKGVAVVSPKTGNKIKIGTIAPGVIVAPNGPLKSVQVIFPSKVTDGQVMFISFLQDVEEVTFTNAKFANKSVLGPKVKAGESITLFYNAGSDKWYKLGGTSA